MNKLVNLNNTKLKRLIVDMEILIFYEPSKRARNERIKQVENLIKEFLKIDDGGINYTWFLTFMDYKRQRKTAEQFIKRVEQSEQLKTYE
jgi:hypothetical protein